MHAYVILDIDVTDPDGYADYKELAPAAVAQYGGEYIVRGGKTETLEGDWNPQRIVVLRFPSTEKAKAWIDSPEYAPGKALRHRYAISRTVLVEGVA